MQLYILLLLILPIIHAAYRHRHHHHQQIVNPLQGVSPYCNHQHDSTRDTSYHMQLVDHSDHATYLVRGGQLSTETDQLNYNDIVRHLCDIIPSLDCIGDDDIYIIDVNLLNIDHTHGDAQRTYHEYQYFQQHLPRGELLYWPIQGTTINITSVSQQYDSQYANWLVEHIDDWIPDNLIYRVHRLYDLLHRTQHNHRTTIIYVHCVCGCDRTGELIGSYEMRYMNQSWSEVNEINQSVPGRPISCNNFLALKSYCYYLNQAFSAQLNCNQSMPCM